MHLAGKSEERVSKDMQSNIEYPFGRVKLQKMIEE
jgi:hypothetical protein